MTTEESRLSVAETQIGWLMSAVSEMKDAAKSMANSLHELSLINQKSSDNYESLKRFYQVVEDNTSRVKSIEKDLENRKIRLENLEESSKDSNKKIWRIVELLIAGLIGGAINWGLVKK